MKPATPSFTRKSITRAGKQIIDANSDSDTKAKALALINHWRVCHDYPLNTFQATLRSRLKKICRKALVAQRLKRVTSIEQKLKRNLGMQLARMQDIGGLRAVVDSIHQVRKLEEMYTDGSLQHELVGIDDYIKEPKESGYRSLHFIYKYNNSDTISSSQYNGLCIELQIRTRLQHAWATAVETFETFLNQPLKASKGPQEWLDYFKAVSAAFALFEKCPVSEVFQHKHSNDVFQLCTELEQKLKVRLKLEAFAVATRGITQSRRKGTYHLLTLDVESKTLSIRSFAKKKLDEATAAYADEERKIKDPNLQQVVLVATDSVKLLRRAFPNYFLDTSQFFNALSKIENLRKDTRQLPLF